MILLFLLLDFVKRIGLGSGKAAAITALLNLGTAIGRLVVGVMSDSFGRIETAGALIFLRCLRFGCRLRVTELRSALRLLMVGYCEFSGW